MTDQTITCRCVLTSSLMLLLATVSSSASAASTVYGINFDVVDTDVSLTPKCQTDPNATVHQKFLLPRYSNPTIQQAVRGQLKGMRESGFQTLRTIVELFPGKNPSGDLIDTGDINESVVGSISSYISDARDAGFKKVILAFATQGPGSAICRKTQWGDCFDRATIPASVEAEAKIIDSAAKSTKGMSLWLDLLNEGCVSAAGPKSANGNFEELIRALAKMHGARFHAIPATVSCQIERTGDGLASLQHLFAESGDHVGFFDIHAYPLPGHNEDKMLAQAANSLRSSNLPVIFGETTYADPEYRMWITASYQTSFRREPPELLFWPLHSMPSHCGFDVAHPYDLKRALGK